MKSDLDELEAMPIYQRWMEDISQLASEATKASVQISECEKEYLKQEHQEWTKICEALENRTKWEEYKEIFENDWEDLEEEYMKIIKECECLGVNIETQKMKIFKTGEEYFKKAEINI